MRLRFNGLYAYRGYWETWGRCGLRIYEDPAGDRPAVVVATEIPDNTTTSVANMAPQLFPLICRAHDLDADCVHWVEHFPARRRGDDRYVQVRFERTAGNRLVAAESVPRGLADVERLVGGPLEPLPAAAGAGR